MEDPVEVLRKAVDALGKASLSIPFDDAEAIAQFQTILAMRRLWVTLPNSRLKGEARDAFIARTLGTIPSDEHLALATRNARKRRLTDQELLDLEIKQGGRCRLCGVLLVRDTCPHVDHILPASLGGSDDLENLQLLCSECNLGKGSTLHWLMSLPYFDEAPGNEPSSRLRYAVLCRFGGRCFYQDCDHTSATAQLFVVPFIGVPEGGRVIFDNLVTYCEDHRSEQLAAQMRRAKTAMSGRKGSAFGFNRR